LHSPGAAVAGPGRPKGKAGQGRIAAQRTLGGKERSRKEEIVRALDACGGNVSKAAALLGMHRTTLINRMLRFGMKLSKRVDGA
jgi:transcriptional regulator of acetoin/glycerol metabolism